MTEKTLYYARMAEEAATQITASREKWTSFLKTAGRLYKYPYEEQLMINAQRPDATACAEYDLWNNVMHRYVKRGSKGIALLDNSGDRPRLKYVFDISDTGERAVSRPVRLMQVTDENKDAISERLTDAFQTATDSTLEEKVMEAAEKLAAEYWDTHGTELLSATKGSYLENYDDYNVGISFRRAAALSIAYTVLTRCTDDADAYFDDEDFLDIFDFNTRQTANALGTATSAVSAQIFREIEIAVRNIDRMQVQEQNEDKEISVETVQPDTTPETIEELLSEDAERSSDERTELSEERGLSDPGRGTEGERDDGQLGEVREDAQDIPEGTPSDDVQRHGTLRDTVSASDRGTGDSDETDRTDDEETSGDESGTGQDDRSDGVGQTHEHAEGAGGGERDDGAGLRVEDEPVQLSLFPTEQEQIERIDREAEVKEASAISLPEDDLDNDLLRGSQFEGGKMRIYALYQHEASASVRAEFLRKEYGLGGHSFQLMNGENGFVDYSGRGVLIHSFRSDYQVRHTWRDAEKRIKRLIDAGIYLNDRDREKWAELEEKYAEVGGVPYPDPAFRMKEPEELISAPERNEAEIPLSDEVEDAEAVQTPGDRTAEYDDAQDDVKLRDVVIDLMPKPDFPEEAQEAPAPEIPARNFRITDDDLGTGGAKEKFRRNMDAIYLLKTLENEDRNATPEEQAVLSQYVGWGGLSDAFDPEKRDWTMQYQELKAALMDEEYTAARASTLNAHYTSPTVIRAIYDGLEQMGFKSGNILEPAMGVGNFFGMLPESMQESNLYGVELDSITGRIAKKLYPEADITVGGFETTDNRDFFDIAIGNVPFGNYKVNDKPYNKLNFNIHNYFFAKALDQVRPGGVVAFVTSRYTMDSVSTEVRKYLAQRAELLGAIRLPNNAFKANAGTEVTSDIIFLQKRERPIDIEPDWVHRDVTPEGFQLNSYFTEHPEMVLGELSSENTQYGNEELTVNPREGVELSELLKEAVSKIQGEYHEAEIEQDDFEQVSRSIPADPSVKNYSFTIVAGEVFFRENSIMTPLDLGETEKERIKGMIALRGIVNDLIEYQMQDYPDEDIRLKQAELNEAYDRFVEKYGLINSSANARAFSDDSSYYLLCSLEDIDDDGQFKGKADMFTKRTIRPERTVTSVDTPSEALAVSISERGRVDLPFMAELLGTPGEYNRITEELTGVIFKDPLSGDEVDKGWQTADEYLSGNVREKLRIAEMAVGGEDRAKYAANVEALKQAQPKDLDASEIDVRLGATWIDRDYIQQFMYETFNPPFYWHRDIQVKYSDITAEWQITGKTKVSRHNVEAYVTYGTDRANAYRILEETLNLKDIRIYDTYEDADGKKKRVLNKKETTLAQQKQAAIKEAFRDWIWKDPERREALVKQYNELFNSTKPREYDGSHIHFVGMNPEIKLRDHQRGAIAHVIYGGNTLLAHEVGAGKTFEMAAAAMESKRLGLCQKSMFVVPNHLTLQWANEFMRLYPSAKILVAGRKDFETKNRKKFCARIASGDYDAVIIGHSQFEKIPISAERQKRLLQEQIDEIEAALAEMKASHGEHFSIKQMEKTRKSLQARMDKLMDMDRKDDVITFEQLGVDRLFVDESQSYKNLFLYTKMRNVAGLSTSESQRAADMFMKARYMDEITGGRGVVFASGTPVSNSMTELYSVMRYLQYGTLQQKNLTHFDCWASTFGETTTSIELAPEGSGYRARTRFAKFFNLPELMNMFKEVADIKMADQLELKVPEAEFETVLVQPSEHQKEMVKALSERAAAIHAGHVDPSEDNMLKVTSDGRKIGLDQRLMNELLPDDPDSKLNACVQNVLRIWEEGKEDKLTQLVFSDMSTPKTDGTFNVYDDIKQKLMTGGVPEEEIAFIHDADTEAKKKELFSKVRKGKVRVLLGSTQKMGAGTNVQDRLYAVHHLDVGWRPSDMTQRNGRIIRQGNECKSVKIFQYVTEGTFDAYLYQTLENKQKFISQIMTSKSPVRSCDDVDEQVLSYAEVKALCAGNPLIKQKMDLDIDVARLKVLKADHQSKQYRLEDQLLKHYPAEIEKTHGFIAGLTKDIETAEAHPQDKENFCGMTVNGTAFAEKEMAGAALIEQCRQFKGTDPALIGEYRGFQMYLSYDSFRKEYDLTLKGEMRHQVYLGSDARGNIQRLDNAIANIPERLERTKNALETLQKEQESAKAELGKPFPQEAELQEKAARLAELDAQLNLDEQGTSEEEIKEDGVESIEADDAELDPLSADPEKRPSVLETLHRLSGQQASQDERIIERAEVAI